MLWSLAVMPHRVSDVLGCQPAPDRAFGAACGRDRLVECLTPTWVPRSTPHQPCGVLGAHLGASKHSGLARSEPPICRVVQCMTKCHTESMAKAISVRLDDDAERALRILEASGLTLSEAIRSSLLASAERLNRRRVLAQEAAALEADEQDRAEMLSVASLMESMRATR
jgi:hypothetical protein